MKKLQSLMDRMMFKVMPSCKEAMELQSEAIDHKLPIHKRALLWMHCAMCGFCRRYGKQIRWLSQKLKALPHAFDFGREKPMPPEMKDRVRSKIQCELAD